MLVKMGLKKEEKSMFGTTSSGSSGGTGVLGGGSEGTSILPSFSEESAFDKCCPKLSYKHRLIGFCCCAALGWALSLVGTLVLVGAMTPENVRAFAGLYVVGNVSNCGGLFIDNCYVYTIIFYVC